MKVKDKISVIGAGAWGTTIAKLLAEHKVEEVYLWVREEERFEGKRLIDIIERKRENQKFLPKIEIPYSIKITSSLEEAVSDSRIIISAIPSQYLREIAETFKPFLSKETKIVSLTKGIEYCEKEKEFKRMSQVLEETLQINYENIVALSGPNIAYEIARGFSTATVVASISEENAEFIRRLFNIPEILRAYRSNDIIGLELGGALKNPYAIGAGICDFLIENKMLGENSKAAYLTRCLNEMINFSVMLGAKEKTLRGLSGLGDLIVTCDSKESRNHYVGYKLAQSLSLKEIEENLNGKIAEGIRTSENVYKYSLDIGYDMNIIKQIYLALYEQKPIKEAITDLMIGETEIE